MPSWVAHPDYDAERDFKGYGEKGLDPKWPNNAKIALSFVINYEEGAEKSVMNGDDGSETHLIEVPGRPPRLNQRALPIESEYEYGSRVGFWRMFRLFNEHRMKFTLYGVAQALEIQPEVAKRCVDEGHDVAAHGYRWIDYYGMPIEKEKEYIRQCITSIKNLTGYAPRGFYYGRSSMHSHTLVPQVYDEMGEELMWYSDSYADDIPYWTDRLDERDSSDSKGLLIVPYSYDCNDFKYHTPGSGFADPQGFFVHLKNAFDVLYEEGEKGMPKMMTVALHCRISGRPGRLGAIKKFVEYIEHKEGVWVATRTEIAESFKQNFPYRKGHLA